MSENTQPTSQPTERKQKQETLPFFLGLLAFVLYYGKFGSVRGAVLAGVLVIMAGFAYQFHFGTILVETFGPLLKSLLKKRPSKAEKSNYGIYDIFLGNDDESGAKVVENVEKMDCFTVIGLRGSGKTTFLHTVVHGLTVNHTPDEVRLVIADLKNGLDFRIFKRSRFLLWPIATNTADAAILVEGLKQEMERRAKFFKAIPADRLCNDLSRYHELNKQLKLGLPHLPLIVAVIDEFQNITNESKEALDGMIKLAKGGRAFGIIIILSTQLPNVDSIPSSLKSQFSTFFCGYMANPSNYYKIAEIPQDYWKPFHEKGKRGGRYIASIAGRVYFLNVFQVPERELERFALLNSLESEPAAPVLNETAVDESLGKRPWKGNTTAQKRAMLFEWFTGFDEMPTEKEFLDEFEASERTYHNWVKARWEEYSE